MCTYSEVNVENTGNCQGGGESTVPPLMMKLSLQKTQRPLSICRRPVRTFLSTLSHQLYPTVTMYVHICIETHYHMNALSVLIRVCMLLLGGWRVALNKDEEQIYFKQKRPRIQKCSNHRYPESYAATSDLLTQRLSLWLDTTDDGRRLVFSVFFMIHFILS